jgi:ArsR family transcriptional regulator
MKKQKEICVPKKIENLGTFFKALADPNRLAIFDHFCRCSRTGTLQSNVNEVSTCCDVDLSVISRHLKSLKNAGVLSAEKKGKQVFYSLNANDIAKTLRDLADEIEGCCSTQECNMPNDDSKT